jgi:hypothetical protein
MGALAPGTAFFVAAVSGDWAAATINAALSSAKVPIRRF